MSHGDRTLRSLRRCRSLERWAQDQDEGDRGRSLVRYLLGMPPRSPPLDADHTSHAPWHPQRPSVHRHARHPCQLLLCVNPRVNTAMPTAAAANTLMHSSPMRTLAH